MRVSLLAEDATGSMAVGVEYADLASYVGDQEKLAADAEWQKLLASLDERGRWSWECRKDQHSAGHNEKGTENSGMSHRFWGWKGTIGIPASGIMVSARTLMSDISCPTP